MGVLDFLRKTKLQNIEIIEGEYQSESVGNFQLPDTLTETNSFKFKEDCSRVKIKIKTHRMQRVKIKKSIYLNLKKKKWASQVLLWLPIKRPFKGLYLML